MFGWKHLRQAGGTIGQCYELRGWVVWNDAGPATLQLKLL